MTTLRQAAQQALEALENFKNQLTALGWDTSTGRIIQVITALRQALEADQKSDPVYWEHRVPVVGEGGHTVGYSDWKRGKGLPHWPHRALYEHPQPAQQPLTEEQINALLLACGRGDDGFHGFARAIERAHCITGEAA